MPAGVGWMGSAHLDASIGEVSARSNAWFFLSGHPKLAPHFGEKSKNPEIQEWAKICILHTRASLSCVANVGIFAALLATILSTFCSLIVEDERRSQFQAFLCGLRECFGTWFSSMLCRFLRSCRYVRAFFVRFFPNPQKTVFDFWSTKFWQVLTEMKAGLLRWTSQAACFSIQTSSMRFVFFFVVSSGWVLNRTDRSPKSGCVRICAAFSENVMKLADFFKMLADFFLQFPDSWPETFVRFFSKKCCFP